jgi:uncharacterized membrane protein YczE
MGNQARPCDTHVVGRRLVQLFVGLALYGLSLAFMVRAELGLDPWDVFHGGIADRLDTQIGKVTIAVGVLVLLGWIPLRQRPGLGTVSNAVLVGVWMDVFLAWLPEVESLAPRSGLLAAGVLLNALATAAYIGAALGPGPRDGLMTGIVARTGRPVKLVRTLIEITVLVAGVALGGPIGVGTIVYAVTIGPLVHVLLPRLDLRPRGVTADR